MPPITLRSDATDLATTNPIHLAAGVDLPLDAATSTFAVLGTRGSGKTYSAAKLAEQLALVGAQVIILDPLDVWWGLRLAADGVNEGLRFVVVGGSHGDLPLDADSASVLADLVVEERLSIVLAVALLSKEQQRLFAAAFFERLYERKAEARLRRPVMVIVDEADLFAPQIASSRAAQRSLEALDALSRRGRVLGIGVTLIGQRAARINKDVLSQTYTLIVHRTNGPQDRDAIKAWLEASPGGGWQKVLDELAELPTGVAWIWSPSAFGVYARERIAPRQTYDASATPQMGDIQIQPQALDLADMERLREHLARLTAVVREEDPAALRRRITELKAQVRDLQQRQAAPAPQPRVERVEVPVRDAALLRQLGDLAGAIAATGQRLLTVADEIRTLAASQPAHVPEQPTPAPERQPTQDAPQAAVQRRPSNPGGATTPAVANRGGAKQARSGGLMSSGQRRVLEALARLHPTRLTRVQVVTLAGLTGAGDTTRLFRGLKDLGYIDETERLLGITNAGRHYLGADMPQCPRSNEEMLSLWGAALPTGARRILIALTGAYPRWLDLADVAAAAELTASGGAFEGYLSMLRNNGLIERTRGRVRAGPMLFVFSRIAATT